MGAGQSTHSVFSSQEHEQLLQKLAGPTDIEYGSSYWDQLVNLQLALAAEDPNYVQEVLVQHCRQLMVHNPITHNFQKLVLHMLDLAALAQNGKPSLAVANSLHIVAVIIKFIVENCSPSALTMVFEVAPNLPAAMQGQPSLLPMFINRLVLLICNVQPNDELSYIVLLEAVLLLLVCCSTQLYTQLTLASLGSHPLLETLMEQQQSARALVGALLQLIVARQPAPPKLQLFTPAADGGTTVMKLVRTAAATVLWIPLRTYQFIWRHGNHPGDGPPSPLGDVALTLLLVLAHYPAHHAQLVNGVKEGLHALQDAAAADAEGGVASSMSMRSHPSISFARLYNFFATGPQSEASTLLLYTLLHGSKSFQEYVLVRSDPETLLVPVLQQLYKANKRRANHLYMLQIIVLILSQDTSFSHNMHKLLLPGNVSWYKERMLNRISLGSLVFVVLLRTAHQNVGQLHDLYLPTNTLAALANLAPQASGLHSHAAQRLVGLTVQLARRWVKLSQAASSTLLDTPDQDIQVLGDFLRILLEVINCILSMNLVRNPELVYALLHKQEVFSQLKGQQGIAELVENIQAVIDYFNSKLDSVNANATTPEGHAEWSVGRVLELVQTFTQSWRGEWLKQLPELRFVYEEEAAPEEFFVPYCWSLAVAATGGRMVSWNLGAVALLTQLSGVEAEGQLEGQFSNASSQWSDEGGLADSQV